MTIILTGGAGFIGSNFIIDWFKYNNEKLINIDNLTYAGNLNNLNSLNRKNNYLFIKGDITDISLIKRILDQFKPRAILNFAAETHVDRSIENPKNFIQTNIIGVYNLLECTKIFWKNLNKKEQKDFRFLHVSTDEVYGSLDKNSPPFSENNQYRPNSPYSASKASSNHLVRSYNQTYGLPTLTTNCSNNYGPYQFPEKLIPLIINNAINLNSLPIYGNGLQIRDWLYVYDHCNALRKVLDHGKKGGIYNIGGLSEMTNIKVVYTICDILDIKKPLSKNSKISRYRDLITFVENRPGHDKRYAINTQKISNELDWKPKENFDSGIVKTIEWYLQNPKWVENVISGEYLKWIESQYS